MISAASAGDGATSDLLLIGRVLLSLLVVVFLAVLAAKLARRAGLAGGDDTVRLRTRVGLGRDASLAVVQVGEKALVLGVTGTAVRLLTTLDAEEFDKPAPADGGTSSRTGRSAGNTDLVRERPARTRRPSFGEALRLSTRRHVDGLRERTVRRS